MKNIGLDVLISIISLRSARAYFSQHAMQLVIRAQSRKRTKQLAMDVYQENFINSFLQYQLPWQKQRKWEECIVFK